MTEPSQTQKIQMCIKALLMFKDADISYHTMYGEGVYMFYNLNYHNSANVAVIFPELLTETDLFCAIYTLTNKYDADIVFIDPIDYDKFTTCIDRVHIRFAYHGRCIGRFEYIRGLIKSIIPPFNPEEYIRTVREYIDNPPKRSEFLYRSLY